MQVTTILLMLASSIIGGVVARYLPLHNRRIRSECFEVTTREGLTLAKFEASQAPWLNAEGWQPTARLVFLGYKTPGYSRAEALKLGVVSDKRGDESAASIDAIGHDVFITCRRAIIQVPKENADEALQLAAVDYASDNCPVTSRISLRAGPLAGHDRV